MAAPKGNEFWKLRSKHGRDKIFKTPELMIEAACEYFEWCEKNPLIEEKPMTVNIGDYMSEIQNAKMPKIRAFTLEGAALYFGANSKYLFQFEGELKGKTDDVSKDFSNVIAWMRDIVNTQQYTGAAAGLLNGNLVSRYLGLADKSHLDLSSSKNTLKDVFEPLLKKSDE